MGRIVWAVLFLAALAVIIPQLVVPLIVPDGTFHAPVEVSPAEPASWPYAFGALVCHQRSDRSFSLDGNQLPVCERCLAIELGMAAAFAAAVIVAPHGGFFASLSAFLPRWLRSTSGVLLIGLALMLPMAIDGGLQLVSAYVSATPQRVGTGLLYGLGQAGIVIGCVAWLAAAGCESLMPSRGR